MSVRRHTSHEKKPGIIKAMLSQRATYHMQYNSAISYIGMVCLPFFFPFKLKRKQKIWFLLIWTEKKKKKKRKEVNISDVSAAFCLSCSAAILLGSHSTDSYSQVFLKNKDVLPQQQVTYYIISTYKTIEKTENRNAAFRYIQLKKKKKLFWMYM